MSKLLINKLSATSPRPSPSRSRGPERENGKLRVCDYAFCQCMLTVQFIQLVQPFGFVDLFFPAELRVYFESQG